MRGAVIAMAMLTLSVPARAETTRLCTAGSLKAAMADITSAFEARGSLHKVTTVTSAALAQLGRRGIAYW